jgi:hypothetical protein
VTRALAALAALALAAAGCVSDVGAEVLPGHAGRVLLRPEPGEVRAEWPVPFRRAVEFVIENGTGHDVETLLVDFSGEGAPRELLEAAITDPPGRNVYVLGAPYPALALRARLGDPGTVLLPPGESLTLRVRVAGTPGASTMKVTIPGRD